MRVLLMLGVDLDVVQDVVVVLVGVGFDNVVEVDLLVFRKFDFFVRFSIFCCTPPMFEDASLGFSL
jgi:hypothetical protein